MKRKSLKDYNCSWAQAAEAIGDKWLIMILRNAFMGVDTFSGFFESIGISKNILTQRLEHLVQHNILIQKSIRPGSKRMRYILSPKGRALFPVMVALGQWGDDWVFGEAGAPIKLVDRNEMKPIKHLQVEGSDGRPLKPSDIKFTAGPGASEATKEAIAHIDNDIE